MHDFEYKITIRYSYFEIRIAYISMETNILVIYQGEGGPDPLPSFGSANASSLKLFSHTYVFFTLCETTLHVYIKSAHDKSHDIWGLELGKVKNTTFLVKRKFLSLRTI